MEVGCRGRADPQAFCQAGVPAAAPSRLDGKQQLTRAKKPQGIGLPPNSGSPAYHQTLMAAPKYALYINTCYSSFIHILPVYRDTEEVSEIYGYHV